MQKNIKKRGLGKGLDALIGEIGQQALEPIAGALLQQIPKDQIQAGKYQPRKYFDSENLNDLTQSIKEHGILQPIVVRPIDNGFEIIAGERRFRAGQQAGIDNFPCVVKNYNDSEALAVALIENLQRSDLNILEVAEGLQKLVQNFSLTHEKAAQLIGKSRSAVSNILRLLDLSLPVRNALLNKDIEMGHARAMLSLELDDQQKLLNQIISKNLTVRQTELKVRLIKSGAPKAIEQENSSDIKYLEGKIASYFGVKSRINQQKKGSGKIVLNYRNFEEFQAILEKLTISVNK